MSLKGLLQAASGEVSLNSALGRWMRAVSRQVTANASLPPYTQVLRSTAQGPLDLTGADLLLDTVAAQGGGGVTYNPVTGIFTLEENITYILEAYTGWQGFATEATDFASVEWVDRSSNVPLIAVLSSTALPPGSTQNASTQPVTKIIYRTPVGGKQVKLRAQLGQGTASLSAGSFAIVRKLQ